MVMVGAERPEHVARHGLRGGIAHLGVERTHGPVGGRAGIGATVLEERTDMPMRTSLAARAGLFGLHIGRDSGEDRQNGDCRTSGKGIHAHDQPLPLLALHLLLEFFNHRAVAVGKFVAPPAERAKGPARLGDGGCRAPW